MINLGCFTHCQDISLLDELNMPILAQSAGIYTFKAVFNNRVIVRELEFKVDEVLKISAKNFNEDSYFMLKVYSVDSTLIGKFIFSVHLRI